MADHKVTFFPVGNGDCAFIQLSDGAQIVIDCNFTAASHDEGDDSRYDVHGHLLRVSKRLDGYKPHVDAYVLTHGDEDHCRGFEEAFYTGDPSKYSTWHADRGLIIIDELWFSPRIFHPDEEHCSSAKVFLKEAERRIALQRSRDASATAPGNRIRIIGFTDNPDFKGIEHLVTVPGTYVDIIDRKRRPDFRFFVHAPFKHATDDIDGERNDTSIVLQAQFDVGRVRAACTAIFAGDAGYSVFDKIVKLSNDETLSWDLFLAPHHCSWTFFGENSEDDDDAASGSVAFLGKRRKGALVVASCKPIRDDDDNPPHWRAAEIYRAIVGKSRFIELGEHPNKKAPLPLELTMSEQGPVREGSPATKVIASSGAVSGAVGTPKTYG